MAHFLQSLFVLLAGCDRDELARQVQYLKVENQILRSKLPKQLEVTREERARLLKFGKLVGPVIRELISIVHPKTFARWIREAANHVPIPRSKGGRPRTAADIVLLILRIAEQTGCGYTRIKGELIKLGLPDVGRTTIQNILKRDGFDPGPGRGPTTWDDFIARHAKTLWAADFLSVKAWTRYGLVDLYLLAFIHIDSRRVWVSPCTQHPTQDWVCQQARNFLMHVEDAGLETGRLLRDRDGKFVTMFDDILNSAGIEVTMLPVRSPNLNAHMERFVQTIKHECLSHFVILSHRHLNYLVTEFVDYYHKQRPHQSKGNRPLLKLTDYPPSSTGDILCEERLGGLLKHYYRKAA